MAAAQNTAQSGDKTLPSAADLEERMTVRGVAEEPLKFRVLGACDLSLVGEEVDRNPELISLPPFVDLTQVLQPLYIPLAGLQTSHETSHSTNTRKDWASQEEEEEELCTNISISASLPMGRKRMREPSSPSHEQPATCMETSESLPTQVCDDVIDLTQD